MVVTRSRRQDGVGVLMNHRLALEAFKSLYGGVSVSSYYLRP